MKTSALIVISFSLFSASCSTVLGPTEERSPASIVSANTLAASAPEEPVKPATEKLDESKEVKIKKRVLILPFPNKTEYGGPSLSQYAADEVKDTLQRSSDYLVVPPEDVDGYEGFTTAQGDINYKIIFDKARATGICAVVVGTLDNMKILERGDEVGFFRTRYDTVSADLKFQLFDTATEKPLVNKTASAEVTEEHVRFFNNRSPESYDSSRGRGAVTKALEKVFPSFLTQMRKIAWTGRIAKIDIHRYYINAGESSGITRGQLLKVYGDGQAVSDPGGNLIGMAPGRFKGILRVVDYFGTDGTVAVLHSGAGIRERDRVEIYTPPR